MQSLTEGLAGVAGFVPIRLPSPQADSTEDSLSRNGPRDDLSMSGDPSKNIGANG